MRRAMIVRMSARGVITIPSEVRRKLGMAKRTSVNMDVDEQARTIILTPAASMSIQELRGRHKGKGLLKALKAEKKEDRG